jgi:calcium-dependent protein kinase
MRRMNHPNIIKMYEVYDIENHLALILEHMDGGNLTKRIQNGSISEKKSFKVVHSLLEALVYMHSMNVIHRDLKPTNVMFKSRFLLAEEDSKADVWDRDEEIKLIDFGLCCST